MAVYRSGLAVFLKFLNRSHVSSSLAAGIKLPGNNGAASQELVRGTQDSLHDWRYRERTVRNLLSTIGHHETTSIFHIGGRFPSIREGNERLMLLRCPFKKQQMGLERQSAVLPNGSGAKLEGRNVRNNWRWAKWKTSGSTVYIVLFRVPRQ